MQSEKQGKMSKTLVIVESPAKAKTIGRYLGPDYKVTASVGHVRDLPTSTLGVDVEHAFKPRYITMPGKEAVLRDLKKMQGQSDNILLATDPDREGEAIAWHLATVLRIDPATPCRISFNEITRKTVQEAVHHPRPINMALVDAQQARRVLDRLVGYELSPLLWKKIRKGLSAGRVQSVTTQMICDREREIKAFRPEEYWHLTAELSTDRGERFKCRYHGFLQNGVVKRRKLQNEAAVKELMASLEQAHYSVHELTAKENRRQSAPPFTTSTLQQEASRYLSYTSQRTMRIAQQLYEGIDLQGQGATALITYIRTDSVRISPEALDAARAYILATYGGDYLPERPRFFKNRKAAQDAHEAIRPAHFDMPPAKIKDQLSQEQYKLYKLIWDKFIASQMASAVFDTLRVTVAADQSLFRCKGEKMTFPGWMKQYGKVEQPDNKDDDDELSGEKLPPLVEGQALQLKRLDPEQKFTQPPARYTEASLIRAMEEIGIGRPSTYAPTISVILSRHYVDKDGRNLYPTDLGFLVSDMLKEHFPDIVDSAFTAQMEAELDTVESGQIAWTGLLDEFYHKFHAHVLRANEAIAKLVVPEEKTGEKCPECGEGELVIRDGRYGKFIACSRYPDCKYTRNLEEEVVGRCPRCGSGLLKKNSRKRRSSIFYVCDRKGKDPNCDFISWDLPLDKYCPDCGAYMVKKRFRGRFYERCSNPECPSLKKRQRHSAQKEEDSLD